MVKQKDLEAQWLTQDQVLERLRDRPRFQGRLLCFSSHLGGWTESPYGDLVGLDDHGFHRGDGVFEAVKVVQGKPYLFKEHYARLKRSADRIGISIPYDFDQLQKILEVGLERAPKPHALLRFYLTRGPGGFSTNPQECLRPSFFIVISEKTFLPEDKYRSGVRIGKSRIPAKPEWMAITKSLNYLPNVMMKKESLERGLDFTIGVGADGGLTESSTENLVLLNRDGVLMHPPLACILCGCTMQRLFDLVEREQLLPTRREAKLMETDLLQAQGAFMVGTTLDVIPVCEYEGHQIPLSEWGPRLRELLRKDQL